MKRVSASILLVIFILNIVGYYGLFMGARFQMAEAIRHNFDFGNYQRGLEVTFKVPLTLPYATDMNDYQRVDGEFNYDGEVYRLVKQRLVHDTLLIVCVKDDQSKKIDKALKDYVKTFADNPVGEKGQAKSMSALSNDYFSESISIEKMHTGWEFFLTWSEHETQLISCPSDPAIKPPRA